MACGVTVRDDWKMHLGISIRKAFDEIVQDPLMDCFRASKESQNFMLDRIEEITMAVVKAATSDKMEKLFESVEQYKVQLKNLNDKLADAEAEKLKFSTAGTHQSVQANAVQPIVVSATNSEPQLGCPTESERIRELQQELSDALREGKESESKIKHLTETVGKLEVKLETSRLQIGKMS